MSTQLTTTVVEYGLPEIKQSFDCQRLPDCAWVGGHCWCCSSSVRDCSVARGRFAPAGVPCFTSLSNLSLHSFTDDAFYRMSTEKIKPTRALFSNPTVRVATTDKTNSAWLFCVFTLSVTWPTCLLHQVARAYQAQGIVIDLNTNRTTPCRTSKQITIDVSYDSCVTRRM